MGDQIDQQNKRLPVVQIVVVVLLLIAAIFGKVIGHGLSEIFLQKDEINDEFIEDALKDVSDQINSDCPIVVDKSTTLVSTQSINNTFKYMYVLDTEVFQGRLMDLKENLRPGVINYYCTNPAMALFRELEVTVIYSYYDKSKNYLFEIKVRAVDCSPNKP
jgi:hypothetical protein